MDRDDFVIAVFLVICEQYSVIKQHCRLRRGGFSPALTDEEIITMEICGEYFKLECDKDIFAYFRAHYLHFFPKLADRSLFARQAANLWQIKAAIQQRITMIAGQLNDPVQIIDTIPLPVCVRTRARRDRCFSTEADFGYCAAKEMHYYGFKLGLRISQLGMITHYPLLPARPHDIQSIDALLEGFQGIAPADKGFIDAYRHSLLLERHEILIVTPQRKNMKSTLPDPLVQFCKRIRKRIETVGSHLIGRFKIDQIRVHDLWHFQHRLIRKILAHTVCVFLNLSCNRTPLDLDGLIAL
ncbi:MAG TPA: IS982 family transposase [Methanosarcina sp.]|nr:IS982 family transposase [Methanosarcina sp.]